MVIHEGWIVRTTGGERTRRWRDSPWPPARSFVAGGLEVKAIRARLGLSQSQFAALLGVSVRTLRNWELGRRAPSGPAGVLLRVAAEHPEAVWEAVRPLP